jgi:hypothetical protein
MIINGTSYRYDVVRIVNGGKFTKEYGLLDQNTDLILAYGTKKAVTTAAKLLSLGGTVGLAEALWKYKQRKGK